ncbi:RNA polymerase sigma factor [Streptosporangium sandarakinum]|uniref:RNA polymerase sigma factor n=1 Tax=Streptosporangium sandarakinum TaxID=1260955 RepID=UPI003720DA71
MTDPVLSELERLFRAEHGRAVAVLTGLFGDLDVAEEAVQEAFAAAARHWPSAGVPPGPAGWIITVARNRAIDRLRREASRADRHAQAALLHARDHQRETPGHGDGVPDDRLRLIFTLLVRSGLCAEAVRLGRLLIGLMPHEPEAAGLLALMLLAESRREARTTPGGDLVVLVEQDRTRWDRALIAEGQAIVRRCLPLGRPGPYQIQAAIQAVHSDAPEAKDTDWRQILALYDRLLAVAPTPVVALNRAVAVAEVEGPPAARGGGADPFGTAAPRKPRGRGGVRPTGPAPRRRRRRRRRRPVRPGTSPGPRPAPRR